MSQTSINSAGKFLDFKQNLDMLTSSVKSIQQDIDDKLHEILIEASSLVKIKKKLNEIDLLIQTVKSLNNNQNSTEILKLIVSIQTKLIDLQNLVVKESQKNVLKCLQAISASQNGFMMSSEIDRVFKLTKQMIEK